MGKARIRLTEYLGRFHAVRKYQSDNLVLNFYSVYFIRSEAREFVREETLAMGSRIPARMREPTSNRMPS